MRFAIRLATIFTLSLLAWCQQSSTLPTVPDEILYKHVFRHIAKYQDLADEQEHQGTPSVFRHAFRTRLRLTAEQEEITNSVAREYMTKVAQIQAQITLVVKQFRAAYPRGRLAPGVTLPPPPPELSLLIEQKNALVIAERDRLHKFLGDDAFSKTDSLIRARLAPNIVVKRLGN